jgi:peroxiredoxin
MESQIAIGEKLPNFVLVDLREEPRRLSEFQGKIVLLCFWSAECDWVERMDQDLRPMLNTWGEQVVYLPVDSNANESLEQIRSIADARGIDTLLLDANSELAERLGAEINPHFFILDQQGILRYQGAFDDINFRQRTPTRNYVREVVEALLVGRLVETDHAAPYGCAIVRFSNLIA